jgi:hypothetical protein
MHVRRPSSRALALARVTCGPSACSTARSTSSVTGWAPTARSVHALRSASTMAVHSSVWVMSTGDLSTGAMHSASPLPLLSGGEGTPLSASSHSRRAADAAVLLRCGICSLDTKTLPSSRP